MPRQKPRIHTFTKFPSTLATVPMPAEPTSACVTTVRSCGGREPAELRSGWHGAQLVSYLVGHLGGRGPDGVMLNAAADLQQEAALGVAVRQQVLRQALPLVRAVCHVSRVSQGRKSAIAISALEREADTNCAQRCVDVSVIPVCNPGTNWEQV